MILVLARENERENMRQDECQNEWLDTRQEQSPCPTNDAPAMGDIIGALKSITTKQANKHDGRKGRKIWQFRYHDHIIRNQDEYIRIWQYIDENPTKWVNDRYYSINTP